PARVHSDPRRARAASVLRLRVRPAPRSAIPSSRGSVHTEVNGKMWADYLSKPRNTSTSLFGPGIEEGGCVPCLPLLNFGLQGTPTGETMVSRYGQQSRCKLGLRVSTPQLLQSILCQFLQILERSAFGEFRVRHGRLPSISCPASASLGLEVRISDCGRSLRGGFDPLRGSKAAISALPESYHNAYSDSGNASSGAKRSSHVCANDCGS